jgi:hypothetical protein
MTRRASSIRLEVPVFRSRLKTLEDTVYSLITSVAATLRLRVRDEPAPTGVHYGLVVTQLAPHPLGRLADVVHQSLRQWSGYRSVYAMRS